MSAMLTGKAFVQVDRFEIYNYACCQISSTLFYTYLWYSFILQLWRSWSTWKGQAYGSHVAGNSKGRFSKGCTGKKYFTDPVLCLHHILKIYARSLIYKDSYIRNQFYVIFRTSWYNNRLLSRTNFGLVIATEYICTIIYPYLGTGFLLSPNFPLLVIYLISPSNNINTSNTNAQIRQMQLKHIWSAYLLPFIIIGKAFWSSEATKIGMREFSTSFHRLINYLFIRAVVLHYAAACYNNYGRQSLLL